MSANGFLDEIVSIAHEVAEETEDVAVNSYNEVTEAGEDFGNDVETAWNNADAEYEAEHAEENEEEIKDENNEENNLGNFDEKSKDEKAVSVDDKDVVFKYYNIGESSEGQAFNIQEFDESKLKGWKTDSALKVITHGWKNSDQSDAVCFLKGEYLNYYDLNLITVDWSGLAKDEIFINSALKVGGVGKIIARLLNDLVKKSLVAWECVHAIGHGLGGHVMGVAGINTEGQMGRISALDPPSQIFGEMSQPDDRAIDSADAKFVDGIHTAGGELGGSNWSCGIADFYPNGGTHPQPGCSDDVKCSNNRAYEFYAESIKNPAAFVGYQCENMETFTGGMCLVAKTTIMGDQTPNGAKGKYYLVTNDAPPYGQG